MSKLKDKVAFITGGCSGIGLATAKLFVAEGAKVFITDLTQEAIDNAVEEIGGEITGILADARDIAAGKRAIEKAAEIFGKIDILFLNAGIAPFSPFEEITEAFFDNAFDTNVKGPFFTIKNAIPHLNERAVIIGNTSTANQKGIPGFGVYAASKAALRTVSRTLTSELSAKNIRSVSLAPGAIDTPIYSKIGLSPEQLEEMNAIIEQQVPLGRYGSPEEIAKAALFLASEDASFVTGVELVVDGGFTQV